ncbi:MoaD/ThiS family protein [Verminephrobacter aporrectodeae]|uniref:Molybdopterin synthase sulfur carrier subunit n=1 Tax=Verminephrobacter aporrectodeae subsp. tuberculatae TaxID=1110392 RepID=A0ABT3KY10_9BURK|nr:MoaD/ThiS family protein [Verminephrobacter aporrectodeae]MCW5256437.1 molybdopterin synthase sulfur carrier subunit [Verminephrobacter aporrectodeae subsp. tuberculatae]MCW5323200.1 molybdopterin synthase sulfur carrier subunit [Verminephrobacter aporrectodeae subsp. tuberculatae]MCW8177265.1 molybdopterin synthase sulfur carrier subunit [Verminephrobacter aporrectodeae subsp. tuberculatae]MCW8200338.1 molybdopterin synthase sulfur carrier subunit [Verminephrobacter aporrectodeae subsp. tub
MYAIQIKIPGPLRSKVAGQVQVQAYGATVGEVLCSLQNTHSELAHALLTQEGQLRSFVVLYLGSRNINSLAGLQTPLSAGSVLKLVQAIVGG